VILAGLDTRYVGLRIDSVDSGAEGLVKHERRRAYSGEEFSRVRVLSA
jgi:hypothetical protein